MRRFLRVACLVATPAVTLAGPATAGITVVSALAPAGTVTDLAVGTVNHPDDAVQFGGHYATDAPIDFFVTLGAGDSNTIYIIDPNGQIANNTGEFYEILCQLAVGSGGHDARREGPGYRSVWPSDRRLSNRTRMERTAGAFSGRVYFYFLRIHAARGSDRTGDG
jgi:hypothetical protein